MRFAEPSPFPEPRRRRGVVLCSITVVAAMAMPAAVVRLMPAHTRSSEPVALHLSSGQASKAFPDERVTVGSSPRPADVAPDVGVDGHAAEPSEPAQRQASIPDEDVLPSATAPEHEAQVRGPMAHKARLHQAHAATLIQRRPHFRGKRNVARAAGTENVAATVSAASTEFASW